MQLTRGASMTIPHPICSFCSEHRHPLCPDRKSDRPPRVCGCDCLFKDEKRNWSPGLMSTPSGLREVWMEHVTFADGRKAEVLHNLPPDAIEYYTRRSAEADAERRKSTELR